MSMNRSTEKKLELQEDLYTFPYHYIAHLNESGAVKRHRVLGWGLEYLCYQRHLIEKVREMNPASVLEVGCGDGYFIGALGDNLSERVGVDFSAKAIGFARAFHPNVDFRTGDAAEIEDQFDVVAAIEVLEHIPDEQVAAFLRVLFDRTRPGGHVVISVPSAIIPLNRKHFRHYTTELLRHQVMAAYPHAETLHEEHVCSVPYWMRFYNKLTANRYLILDIGFISNWLWRRLWAQHRIGDAGTGRHVVGVFRKADHA